MRIVDSFSSWTRHALGEDGIAEIAAATPADGRVRFARFSGTYNVRIDAKGYEPVYVGGKRDPIIAFREACAKLTPVTQTGPTRPVR